MNAKNITCESFRKLSAKRCWPDRQRRAHGYLRAAVIALSLCAIAACPPLSRRTLSAERALVPPGKGLEEWDGLASVSRSPSGRLIIGSTFSGNLALWDVRTGKGRILKTNDRQRVVSDVEWVLGGRALMTNLTFGKRVEVWDAESLQSRNALVLAEDEGMTWRVSVHPNRRIVAVTINGARRNSSRRGGSLILWDAKRGHRLAEFWGFTALATTPAWSPDGSFLATGTKEGSVILWTWDKLLHQEIVFKGDDSPVVGGLSWSPDGQRLTAVTLDRKVLVWDVKARKRLLEIPLDERGASHVRWAPSGKRLVVAQYRAPILVWDIEAKKQLYSWTLGDEPGVPYALAISPDGKTVAAGAGLDDGRIALWNLTDGSLRTVLAAHSEEVRKLIWHPSGKRLTSGSADGRIMIWDVSKSKPLKVFRLWELMANPQPR